MVIKVQWEASSATVSYYGLITISTIEIAGFACHYRIIPAPQIVPILKRGDLKLTTSKLRYRMTF